jgi:nicotinamide mononucleotide transporter
MYPYLTFLEPFSTVISLLTLWLGIRQKIATWPISIIITLLNLLIYHQGKLYDRWIVGIVSIVFSLYGWYQWRYGGPNHTLLRKITKVPVTDIPIVLTFLIFSTTLLSQLLLYLGSKFPYLSSFVTALVLIGLWMSANKKLENYLIWILVNVLYMYIHYHKGYNWFTVKYTVYLVSTIWGYYRWSTIYAEQQLIHTVSS